LYFGNVIHQVLDRAHIHYKRTLFETGNGEVPSDLDLFGYFRSVEKGLFARSISPFSRGPSGKLEEKDNADLCSATYDTLSERIGNERASAFVKIRLFNSIYGKDLYPKIVDTECRLDVAEKDYSITGVVDVLKHDELDNIEIWDYKSYKSSDFDNNSPFARDAILQMQVYCRTYELRTGIKPSMGVIVCIGDLDPKLPLKKQSGKVMHNVDKISTDDFEIAINEFRKTIEDIRKSSIDRLWKESESPDDQTCDACPIRWSCRTKEYPRRFP